jgi:hypothetical protein
MEFSRTMAPNWKGADTMINRRGPAPELLPRSASNLMRMQIRTLIGEVLCESAAKPSYHLVDFVRKYFPGDEATVRWIEQRGGEWKERAASTITSLTSGGVSTATVLQDALPLVGPGSMLATLAARTLNIGDFGEASSYTLPELVITPDGVTFIAEGGPFPVLQLAFSSVSLTPKKVGFIFSVRRELFSYSSAEAVLMEIVKAKLGVGLEKLLLDATAASTTRPRGLKNNIAATGASSKSSNEAMAMDISTITGAVSAVSGMNQILLCHPRRAINIAMRKTTSLPFSVLAASQLGDDEIMAVGLNTLAFAGSVTPRIERSDAAVLVMDDSNPTAFSTPGSPATIGAPIISNWQSDTISIRLVADLNWVLRSDTGVAWIDSIANW